MSGLGQTPLAVSCGADGSFPGGEDGTPDPQRTKQAIAQLQQKILKLTEQIKIEQTARDDNVAEYLKLANNADKQQSTRIKQVKYKTTSNAGKLMCINTKPVCSVCLSLGVGRELTLCIMVEWIITV